jgi:RNA polymerase sigma factor (sigma-70 family)
VSGHDGGPESPPNPPGSGRDAPPPAVPDAWFRHEFGRLVSVLSRRFGVHRLEACEDAAQTALLRAVELWPGSRAPDDRGAWLYRVAHHHVVDALRRETRRERLTADAAPEAPEGEPSVHLASEVTDDVLRMLFVCADPGIPPESQLVLALKTLCGFSTEEIALRLFQSEDAVHKRLQRARARLSEEQDLLDGPPLDALAERLPSVLRVLYLLFNEGYSSSEPDRPIRRELCEEAVRLALLLVAHPVGAIAETDALLAVMYLHAARFDARFDPAGGLLLLEDQDRSRWDRELVALGLYHLQRAARGERFSAYHAEAGIAAEHCLAPSWDATRWDEITRLYAMLERIAPSPLHTLNRAIALAAWKGPDAGLAVLQAFEPPAWLSRYYLWHATLGELHRRRGDRREAVLYLERALSAAPTNAEKALLERRLAQAR